jgi:hypothetical protein
MAPRGSPDAEHVEIAKEDALIVWEPASGVEHFIRRAQFDTKSPDVASWCPRRRARRWATCPTRSSTA